MYVAKNLLEAEIYFRENSSGSLLCESETRSEIVKSYPEAKTFFNL